MRITKLVHSCLLVDIDDRKFLIDPGLMSRQAVAAADIDRLDAIVITHDHYDHMDIPLISGLVERLGEMPIVAPAAAAQQLQDAGLAATTQAVDGLELFVSPHETVEPLAATPDQHGVHIGGVLTHPGDSHSFGDSREVLALPVTAPWGSTIAAIELAIKLGPKRVLPIHDWHWSDEARQAMYDGIGQALARHDIEFVPLITGEPVELDIDRA